MILKMYSVRDGAVDTFMRPWFARSDGEARRGMMDEMSNPQSQLARHPEDFSLFYVGEFDDETGLVSSPLQPVNLGLASSYKVAS